MPHLYVHVDLSDVFDEFPLEEIEKEVERRKARKAERQGAQQVVTTELLLQRVYEHFKRSGDAPECVREYLWDVLGKCV